MPTEYQLISMLTEGDVAKELSVSKALLRKWRRLGEGGPPFIHLGKAVRYPLESLRQWLSAQVRVG
jgi:transposase-like protein